MNTLRLDDIKVILETVEFETLVGKVENEFFECKRGIYSLTDDFGKRELAKDVTSFANLAGGYILIGPQTEKNEKHLGDEIKTISYLHEGQINFKQYYDVIQEWVYPAMRGLNISWYKSKMDPSKGIYGIHIPIQPDSLKPFLIKKTLDEKKRVEIVFGYVERKRDNSTPRDVTAMHALLRDGINYNKNIDDRFSKIESLLGEFKKKEELNKKEELFQYVKKQVAVALKDVGMDKLPNFSLIAYPDGVVEVKSIFMSNENSIKFKLEYPPELRYAGWDMATLDRAQIKEGKFIRVKNWDRKIIDLYRNGSLIFSALANQEFLSWGRKENGLKLNSLAIIESVCNFVIFYNEVLKDFNNAVETIMFCYSFNNLWIENNKYYLAPYSVGSTDYQFDRYKKDAPRSSIFSDIIAVKTNEFDNIGKIAYNIVEHIYLWFGIAIDGGSIPYTKQVNGTKMIDIEQIKKVR